MALFKKLTPLSFKPMHVADMQLTSMRIHPNLYTLVKKKALVEKISIRRLLEKMIMHYLNGSI